MNILSNHVRQALFVVVLSVLTAAAHGATFRTVSLTGQQAAGMPSGVNYKSFSFRVELNDSGQAAFLGADSTNHGAIWSEGSGTLALVVAHGRARPRNRK